MVQISLSAVLLLAASSGLTSAMPAKQQPKNPNSTGAIPSNPNWVCSTPKGTVNIKQNIAVKAMNTAPGSFLTQPDVKDSKAESSFPSGYPHIFWNGKMPGKPAQAGEKWGVRACDKLAAGTKLNEFPIFADGKVYNHNSKEGKQANNPGYIRAIYTVPKVGTGKRTFCGIIAHYEENDGKFKKCTVEKAPAKKPATTDPKKPATPKPATPKPATPKPTTPKPTVPKPSLPKKKKGGK